jgi:hypothetical protein
MKLFVGCSQPSLRCSRDQKDNRRSFDFAGRAQRDALR